MVITASQKRRALKMRAKQGAYEKKRKLLERKLSLAKTPRFEAAIKRQLKKLDKRVDKLHGRIKKFFAKASKVRVRSLKPVKRKKK